MNNKKRLLDFEVSYSLNKDKLPLEWQKSFDTYLELREFHFGVRKAFIEEAKPLLKKLMNKQFNGFSTLTHPEALKYLDTNNEVVLYGIIGQLNKLCEECRQKIDLLEKYPKLERWRKFYAEPPQPDTIKEESRKYQPRLTDEEWEAYKQLENKRSLRYFQWAQKRQDEYYEIIQPLAFRYLPDLNNLERDFWVLFAVAMIDSYSEWQQLNEHLEMIIDYELPLELVNKPILEVIDIIRKDPDHDHKTDMMREKRNKKIGYMNEE